jgi:hypothetical protein
MTMMVWRDIICDTDLITCHQNYSSMSRLRHEQEESLLSWYPDIRETVFLISGYQDSNSSWYPDNRKFEITHWLSWREAMKSPDIRLSGYPELNAGWCRWLFRICRWQGGGRPLAFCLNGKEQGAKNPRGDLSSKNSAIPQLWRAPLKKRGISSEGSNEAMSPHDFLWVSQEEDPRHTLSYPRTEIR